VVDGGGEGQLEWLCLEDVNTGERTVRPARGLFLLLGAEPRCDWLPPELARDRFSFVLTGRDVPRERWVDGVPPANLATTVPGIFAVDEAGRRGQWRGRVGGAPRARVPRSGAGERGGRRDPRLVTSWAFLD
jgi:thioredoxin reductase